MKRNSYNAFLASSMSMISVAGALAFAQPAFAAEGDDAAADDVEIVVTARKVKENLQEAPLSINAFSAEKLEQRGIKSLADVARSTPGFAFENFNGAFATPTIRGQSQTRLTNPVQNVATFYNGVYLQRGYMIDPAMVNIGQVSVLKGPQSAALGRNAYAGAINFQSKEPGNEYHAMLSGSYGENGYRRGDASVEVPIARDVLSLIGGVSVGKFDGGWNNNHPLANNPEARTKGKLGGYDYTSYHAGLKFTPIDDLTIKANYVDNRRDVENPAAYVIGTASFDNRANSNTNNCSQATLVTGVTAATFLGLYCGTIPVEPVIGVGENRPAGLIIDPRSGVKLKSTIFNASAEYKLSQNVSVDYVFGRATSTFDGAGASARNQILGLSGSPYIGVNLIDTTGNGSISSSSHEIRLTYKADEGITAYAGGYFSTTNDFTKFNLLQVPAQISGFLNSGIVLSGAGLSANSLTKYNISSAFGFLEYKSEAFAVSFEGRYTREKVSESDIVASTSAPKVFNYFTPRVTATAFLSPDSRIYVSYARGIKAGGFNTGGSNPANFGDPTQTTYDTEQNNTFEIGSRNEFLNRKLVLNATAYIINGTNVQVNRAKVQPTGVLTLGTVIGNLGSTKTFGLEFEADFKASRELNIYAGLGYNNAHYGTGVIDTSIVVNKLCNGVVCNANGDIGGNRLERNPRLNMNAGFGYNTPVSDDVSVFVNGLVSHQGSQFVNNTNVTSVPGRTIVDASVGFKYKFAEFKLSAENLFDTKYVSSAFTLTGGSSPFFYQRMLSANLGDRRRISGSVTVKF